MGSNDKQIDGDHYQAAASEAGVQHWDFAADMPYLEGRATAYLARHQRKNGHRDVLKSLHFIEKILEVRYKMKLNWEVTTTEESDYNVNQ